MPGLPTRLVPPWEPLYDAVGVGMWAYTSSAFRIRLLTPGAFRLEEGIVFVATHRAETDVPLICGQCYFDGRLWRERQPRLHFAARDDLFDRGFFAGFPPGLPLRARRLLFPICAGRYLPRVRVNPLPYPSADVLRIGRALEEVPAATRLAEVVPPQLLTRLVERARSAGLPSPSSAGDVLRGAYADLIWESFTREELDAPQLADVWRRRAERAVEDVRNVVELVRSGAPTLFFPEGRPSPDGGVGPLRPGLGFLVRRGKPRALRAIGIAYDPVTCGRPWAYVAVGAPFLPAGDEVEAAALSAMREALPLTCGQMVAQELNAAAQEGLGRIEIRALDAALAREVDAAAGGGRPLDPGLLDTERRRGLLADALRFAVREGLARPEGPRALVLDSGRIAADERLRRLVREHASAS